MPAQGSLRDLVQMHLPLMYLLYLVNSAGAQVTKPPGEWMQVQ